MKKIIYGDINLVDIHLEDLPDLFDVQLNGVFDCSNNQLTNLVGSPHYVKWSFSCEKNPLINLKGIPEYIGGYFYIDAELKDKFPENYIRMLSDIQGEVRYMVGGLIDWDEWEQAPAGDY